MLLYFSFYGIIIALSIIISSYQKKHKIRFCKILIVISVLLLALFAAVRDVSVGTDVTVYLYSHFNRAGRFGFVEFITQYKLEPLYYAMVWIIQRLFNNIHVFFFFHQLIIASIVYYVGWKYLIANRITFPLYIFMYVMMWYGTTFNIIRQTMGITIVFLAHVYLKKNKWIKYFVAVIIGSLFHISVLSTALIPIIWYVSHRKYHFFYTIVGGIAAVFALSFFSPLFNLINSFGTFDRYSRFFGFQHINFNINYFLIKLLIFIGLFLFAYIFPKRKTDQDVLFLMNISIVDLFGYCVSLIIQYGYRLSYPFLIYNMLLIPLADKCLVSRNNRRAFRVFTVVSMIVYWYYRYVKIGYDGIYPYEFM